MATKRKSLRKAYGYGYRTRIHPANRDLWFSPSCLAASRCSSSSGRVTSPRRGDRIDLSAAEEWGTQGSQCWLVCKCGYGRI